MKGWGIRTLLLWMGLATISMEYTIKYGLFKNSYFDLVSIYVMSWAVIQTRQICTVFHLFIGFLATSAWAANPIIFCEEAMDSLLKNPLIVVAMDIEEQSLLGGVTHTPTSLTSILNGSLLDTGMGRSAVVLKSGIGLVQAGVNVAGALEAQKTKGQYSSVILLGVAGALDNGLSIGALVLGTEFLQHDSVITGPPGLELMAPGHPFLSVSPDQRKDPLMKADERLVKILSSAFQKQDPSRQLFQGLILSGSEFVGTPERKKELKTRFPSAWVVEMEASAVAQVTRLYGVPFVAIKTVADTADPASQSVHDEYRTFLENSAKVAKSVLQILTGHSVLI